MNIHTAIIIRKLKISILFIMKIIIYIIIIKIIMMLNNQIDMWKIISINRINHIRYHINLLIKN